MFRFFNTKKKTRLTLGVVVVALAIVATAVAYWTSSGEGTGTAKSNYASASFEVSSGLVENLYPGGSATVTVKVKDYRHKSKRVPDQTRNRSQRNLGRRM